jgi:hypothetical protein
MYPTNIRENPNKIITFTIGLMKVFRRECIIFCTQKLEERVTNNSIKYSLLMDYAPLF